jgi:hypothetical protein
MSKTPMLAFTPLLVLLGGCDGSDGTPQQPVTKIEVAKDNPYQKQLLALTETSRMLTLRRAVQDDGGSCNKVTGSRYQQDYKGMAMWVAYCSSGLQAVYVAPSGDVQARPCKDSVTLGLPECVAAPNAPDAPPWPNAADTLPPPPPVAR